MKKLIIISSALLLGACASPAQNMSPQQVSQLSDLQLCQLKNSYAYEQKTEIEIGKRNLNCHPAYMECASRGLKNGTPEMSLCANQVQENWAMQQRIQEQERELERQRRLNRSQQWQIPTHPNVTINQY